VKLQWAAASDAGRVRPGNEDAAVAEEGIFAVADGMGGHAAGEVASHVAIDAIRSHTPADGIVEAVRVANRAVWERADEDPRLRGMGTTMCALGLVDDGNGPQVRIVNVGDSRAYLLRDGVLEQITDDHSLPADMAREGRITVEEAKVHPQRNILTRVLGNDPDVEIDEFPIDPFRGDRFVLCSDGLFNEVDDEHIATVLRREHDPQVAVDELVRLANEGGGRDNITVVVVDVLDDDDKARTASAALAGSASRSRASLLEAPSAATPSHASPEPPLAAGAAAHHRRLTWRSALFVVLLAAILAVAAGSVWWVGRSTFYVGLQGNEVTIFRGRPGGVLWIDPTIEVRTGLRLTDVPASRRSALRDGKEEPSLQAARRYVANLREQAEAEERATTTTTTTSSTTTAPATTSASAP
jgi:serine/threonine protein phosphatase PrpC